MKNRGLFRLLVLVTVFISARAGVTKSYFLSGGELTLRPTITVKITSILWKFKGDLLAEWIENNVELTYYGEYNNRTELDIKTGELVISKMDATKDSGSYTVEINNKVHGESYDAVRITEVDKPKVVFKPLICGQLNSCNVSCEGKTPEAEPITYTWKKDGKVWEGEVGEKMEVLKADVVGVRTFSCKMKNPVGEEESGPEENPLFEEGSTESSSGGKVAAAVLIPFSIIAGILAVAGYLKRDFIKSRIWPPEGGDPANRPAENELKTSQPADRPLLEDNNGDGKKDTPASAPDSTPAPASV